MERGTLASGWFDMMVECFSSEPDPPRLQTQMIYRCFYWFRGEEPDQLDTKHASVSVTQLCLNVSVDSRHFWSGTSIRTISHGPRVGVLVEHLCFL